jgi:hypothetical protein
VARRTSNTPTGQVAFHGADATLTALWRLSQVLKEVAQNENNKTPDDKGEQDEQTRTSTP